MIPFTKRWFDDRRLERERQVILDKAEANRKKHESDERECQNREAMRSVYKNLRIRLMSIGIACAPDAVTKDNWETGLMYGSHNGLLYKVGFNLKGGYWIEKL